MRGFTLIEAVVVIGIISIVIALGTDLFVSVIKTSNKATVINTLKQNVSSSLEEFERTARAGYGLPIAESTGSRKFVTILHEDRTKGIRYQVCLLHPTTNTCLADTQSCPTGTNCVGHIRKYQCQRVGFTNEYACPTDLGSLTNLNRVSGVDLVTQTDVATGSVKYSRFEVVSRGTSVTLVLRLYALQGPDAPSRQDYTVCESTNIDTCEGIVELSSTVVLRQR